MIGVAFRLVVMIECDVCEASQLYTGADPEAAYSDAEAEGWSCDPDTDLMDLCPGCAQRLAS